MLYEPPHRRRAQQMPAESGCCLCDQQHSSWHCGAVRHVFTAPEAAAHGASLLGDARAFCSGFWHIEDTPELPLPQHCSSHKVWSIAPGSTASTDGAAGGGAAGWYGYEKAVRSS